MDEPSRGGFGVIIGHGRFTATKDERGLLRQAGLVIAADGGVRYAWAAGRRPDVAVGDWDSLGGPAVLEGCRVIEVPREKDETDLELALQEALRLGCREIVFLGALGGRLDQTLANVQLLVAAARQGVRATIVDGRRRVFALVAGDTAGEGAPCAALELEGRPGEYLSLVPVTPVAAGVWTEGLKYPLRGEDLDFGRTRGISNEFLGRRARVRLTNGALLVVKPGERPARPAGLSRKGKGKDAR